MSLHMIGLHELLSRDALKPHGDTSNTKLRRKFRHAQLEFGKLGLFFICLLLTFSTLPVRDGIIEFNFQRHPEPRHVFFRRDASGTSAASDFASGVSLRRVVDAFVPPCAREALRNGLVN